MNGFEELKARYAQHLKKSGTCIAEWLDDEELPPLKDIEILVHSLAGTGATFGYDDVSRVAGKIDTYISRGKVEEASLREQLSDLRTVLARD